LKEQWCIPPEASGEFVWRMEDVLEVYRRPYDPRRPQVCLDEKSVQLLGDVRAPLPMGPGRPARQDSEYQRHGTVNIFLAVEPLANWRTIQVTERRTKKDFALFLKDLVDRRYAQAEVVVLVMDNLNTHSPASLYEAFEPAEAKRIADKLEIHHTPKHGSWLDMAEIELSVLGRRLAERLADRDSLATVCAAVERERNESGLGIDWRFTAVDARIRLKRLYPSIGA
jgi:transposase